MDQAKHSYFLSRFRAADVDELAELCGRRNSLAAEAVSALDTVLSERGIDRDILDRYSKISAEKNESDAPSKELCGVRGWLLLLVIGLMFLGPLMGLGRIYGELMLSEDRIPGLSETPSWIRLKSVTFIAFSIVAALSFYAGLGLAMRRDKSAVEQAKIILWVIGPVASLVFGWLIPLLAFDRSQISSGLLGNTIGSTIIALIWTMYLAKSRRVRATYGTKTRQRA